MGIKAEFKGYVRFPEEKSSKAGNTYSSYKVNVGMGKDKATGKGKYYSVRCMDFAKHPLPAEGAYVKVTGDLKIETWEKDGQKFTNADCFVETLELIERKEPTVTAGPDNGVPDWLANA